MKKIISILFILCFLNGNYVIAQWHKQVIKNLKEIKRTGYRGPVPRPVPDFRLRVPDVPQVLGFRLRVTDVPQVPDLHLRVPDAPPVPGFRLRVQDMLSVSNGFSEGVSIPSKFISIDMENRGFIQELHLSSPSERPRSTIEIIENNHEPLYSPSNINILTSPPKVNLDKLRMKVMKCQDRLNKNEMIVDEFIFIGLLIYHNEYGEYYITNYAA